MADVTWDAAAELIAPDVAAMRGIPVGAATKWASVGPYIRLK